MHGVGEDDVDELLRDGVLVDLYPTVRHGIRVSEHSYSIKKLEPLYMGTNLRSGDVNDAGASRGCLRRSTASARRRAGPTRPPTILAGISDYNRYDCLSTLELRNWLLGAGRGTRHRSRAARSRARRPARGAPARRTAPTTARHGPMLRWPRLSWH